jgi:hypothetical protein
MGIREPEEVLVASPEAVYTYAGHLADGTQVVRDSDGLLHALVPLGKKA